MNEDLIQEICKYILDNYAKSDEDLSLSLAAVADEFHYNICHLLRSFKEYTGFTVTEFINECRVYSTIDPLVFTDETMVKISREHGFKSQNYFSERFKGTMGIPPLKFRKRYSNLANKTENADNIEELKMIKAEFEELKEYQKYLNCASSEFTSKEQERRARPKIFKLQ